MTTLNDGNVGQQATRNDPRTTRFGASLRHTRSPNCRSSSTSCRGSMSIVGPRPHAVTHNEVYRQIIKAYMVRHKVKPGITGWAQVNGQRGETDTIEKMRARVEYDLDLPRADFIVTALAHKQYHALGFIDVKAGFDGAARVGRLAALIRT